MHAYLIIGQSSETISKEVNRIAKKNRSGIIEQSLQKIGDVRNLREFVKLTINKPTAIVSNDIDGATDEASNAFLKHLEEPQKNIIYILTARNIKKVLPTIVSRSIVIQLKPKSYNYFDKPVINKFVKSDKGTRFEITEKIKTRQEALDFLDDLIHYNHKLLIESAGPKTSIANNIELSGNVRSAIMKNANITIQLSMLVVGLK